jgi:hypothetical protein
MTGIVGEFLLQRERSRFFNFSFFTDSVGLLDAPSNQRRTCCMLTACVVVGSRTSTSKTVAGATTSIHGSAFSMRTATTTASYKDSACTSAVWRMPRVSLNETSQDRKGTGEGYQIRFSFAN